LARSGIGSGMGTQRTASGIGDALVPGQTNHVSAATFGVPSIFVLEQLIYMPEVSTTTSPRFRRRISATPSGSATGRAQQAPTTIKPWS